jgi:putative cell wall-binding protein
MIALDAFKGHLTDAVKNQLLKMNTEFVVIPGGMTSVLQPMDVSINKPFNL